MALASYSKCLAKAVKPVRLQVAARSTRLPARLSASHAHTMLRTTGSCTRFLPAARRHSTATVSGLELHAVPAQLSKPAALPDDGPGAPLPGSMPPVEPPVDPMAVFNRIDTNGDGVLSREEFNQALAEMHYTELHTTLGLLSKSLSRNELSRTSASQATDTDESVASLLQKRVLTMLDVTVSKIFPAGFGWQYFSGLAESAGHASTELSFFLYTGVGDGVGVLTGHVLFSLFKKMTYDKTIDLSAQLHTGLLLGTAAFCSGTAWQPVVNTLSGAGYSFNATLLGTTAVCGLSFFGGLRLGRLLYSPQLSGVAEPTYANLKADAALSLAIGGATGAFVGTDVSFADNWLRPSVGIESSAAVLAGCATAGASTSLGFCTAQMVQNLTYPRGKAWLD